MGQTHVRHSPWRVVSITPVEGTDMHRLIISGCGSMSTKTETLLLRDNDLRYFNGHTQDTYYTIYSNDGVVTSVLIDDMIITDVIRSATITSDPSLNEVSMTYKTGPGEYTILVPSTVRMIPGCTYSMTYTYDKDDRRVATRLVKSCGVQLYPVVEGECKVCLH